MKEIAEKWGRMGMDERKPYMKMAIIGKNHDICLMINRKYIKFSLFL